MGNAFIYFRCTTESSRHICQRDCFSLNAETTTIGRDSEADICLDFERCFRMEAAIIRRGDCYILKELRASNGTRVGDTPLCGKNEIELQHGDRIYIGGSASRGFWLEFSHEVDERSPSPDLP